MKRIRILQKLGPALAGVLVSGSTALAATAITNNFNTEADMAGWSKNYGGGAVEWSSNMGVDGSGALKVTLSASDPANSKIGPLWQLGDKAFNSSDYVQVEYDVMIDPSSGLDAGAAYGNWQEVLRDASWSWESHWVGALNDTSWAHKKFAVPNTAKVYAMLGFELGGTAPYTSDVIVYIDNIVISPFQNPLVLGAFNNATELDNWTTAARATLSYSTLDAAGSATSGSMKVDLGYEDPNSGWQEGFALLTMPFSPARYTYFAFDIYVDPYTPSGWGHLIKIFDLDWKLLVNDIGLSEANVGKWTHYEIPLPADIASVNGLRIQIGGSQIAPIAYYLDNIKVYKPTGAPTIGLKKAGAAGVEIRMDDNTWQWQREAIATPSDANASGFFWTYQPFPVTYSFTIADFPDATKHPGFDAHLYIVNADTDDNNETRGDCDWGAADIVRFSVANGDAGGIWVSLDWKTNLSGANPPGDPIYHLVGVGGTTAIGTWSLTFTDMNHGFVSGPGIPDTSFELPADVPQLNFAPATSFLQFGFFKNDGANDGHNNQVSGTFSAVKFTGISYPIDEKFTGASLTTNYAWRKTKASAVNFVPPGTAWWVDWTLPADGFLMESAPTITGPWASAGLTTTNQVGAKMIGTVPTSALPSTDQTFFRLTKP